jgi:uncharacterized protein (UPF0212 family)
MQESSKYPMIIVNKISESFSCDNCATRLRFGDTECPHCGNDMEQLLELWADDLLKRLSITE